MSAGPLLHPFKGGPLNVLFKCYDTLFVVAIDHNKSLATSSCKRFLAGLKGQLYIYCWPIGPATDWRLPLHSAIKEINAYSESNYKRIHSFLYSLFPTLVRDFYTHGGPILEILRHNKLQTANDWNRSLAGPKCPVRYLLLAPQYSLYLWKSITRQSSSVKLQNDGGTKLMHVNSQRNTHLQHLIKASVT